MNKVTELDVRQGSPEWLAERAKRITSTDMAVILGIHPWRSESEVWLEKMGRGEPFEPNIAMRKGTALEQLIRILWVENVRMENLNHLQAPSSERQMVFTNSDYPLWLASLDGQLFEPKDDGPPLGTFEAKHSDNDRWKHVDGEWFPWGENGSSDIPDYHMTQVQVGLACSGLPEWDMGAILKNEFRHFRGPAIPDVISGLYEHAEKWWRDYVTANRMPPADGSKGMDRALISIFPRNMEKELMSANAAQTGLAEQLRNCRILRKAAADRETQVIQQLKQEIGTGAGIRGVDWSIHWKLTNPKAKPDWQQIVRALVQKYEVTVEELEGMTLNITRTAKPTRPFKPYVD